MSELQTTEGFFILEDAGAISQPVTNACAVLQTQSINGRTAGVIYIYKGDGVWEAAAD